MIFMRIRPRHDIYVNYIIKTKQEVNYSTKFQKHYKAHLQYSQTCIKRSSLGRGQSDLIRRVQFSMTAQERVTFKYRWLHGQVWLYIHVI